MTPWNATRPAGASAPGCSRFGTTGNKPISAELRLTDIMLGKRNRLAIPPTSLACLATTPSLTAVVLGKVLPRAYDAARPDATLTCWFHISKEDLLHPIRAQAPVSTGTWLGNT
jgi:hypothetical protein